MRKRALTTSAVAALLVTIANTSVAVDRDDVIFVIANKAVAAKTISDAELRPMFQTRKRTWPDGSEATAFNLPPTDVVRRGFDAAVLGLDPDRVARYWLDRKVRGGDPPPKTAPSAAVMLKVVSKTPGAIGYAAAGVVDASVKVVAKIVDGRVVAP